MLAVACDGGQHSHVCATAVHVQGQEHGAAPVEGLKALQSYLECQGEAVQVKKKVWGGLCVGMQHILAS